MSVKKTTNKKPAARTRAKAAPKKAAPKKTAAKKAAPKPKAQTKAKQKAKQRPKAKKTTAGRLAPRRPPTTNPDIPMGYIEDMEASFISWRDELEDFARHLRSLDRRRLNGVGIKKQGFIERALLLASENSEFLPHYLTLRKFQADNQYYLALSSVFDVLMQVRELLWNVIIEASDVIYTDALEYYSSVREAAKRRVDPAETLFNDLSSFFKSRGIRPEENGSGPTLKQLTRDFKALQHGKRDGKIVIENIKPRLIAGKHKVIDETFKDAAHFKEASEEDIIE